jgi:hypothetical protein
MPIQTGYYWPIYDYPDEPDDFYTSGRKECLVGGEGRKIIGWKTITSIEKNVGINGEQYDTVTNYEPIFEDDGSEKV